MIACITFMAALATLAGPPLPAANGKAALDVGEYVLTVEGMT